MAVPNGNTPNRDADRKMNLMNRKWIDKKLDDFIGKIVAEDETEEEAEQRRKNFEDFFRKDDL